MEGLHRPRVVVPACVLALWLLATCTSSNSNPVRVRLSIEPALATHATRPAAASAGGFSCFGLLVTGEGIPSLESGTGNVLPSNYCSYAGASSGFVPSSAQSEVEALVPPGRNRRIQVVGLDLGSELSCPTITVAQFLAASNRNLASVTNYGGLYEIGYLVRDILGDTAVEVPNTYVPATPLNLRGCVGGASSLEIYPKGPAQFALSSITPLSATGGSGGGYVFTKVSGNGTVAGNLFTASAVAGESTTVRVTDSDGNTKSTVYTSFAFSNAPVLWYTAESFSSLYSDGQAISASWIGTGPNLARSGAGTATFRENVLNTFPTVRLSGQVNFNHGSVGGVNLDDGHSWLVARIHSVANYASLFCLSKLGSCSTTYKYGLFVDVGPPQLYAVSAGASTSTLATTTPPAGFFISHVSGPLSATGPITLEILGGALVSGATISGTSFSPASYFFLGGADSNAVELEIAEFIYQNAWDTGVQSYLQSKYQLN